MKSPFFPSLGCVFAFSTSVLAGTASEAKIPAVVAPVPPTEDHWEFTLSPYAWGAGLEGVVGIRGFNASVDLTLEKILNNLDMIAFMSLEARHGRWGGWIDGAYLKISGGPTGPRSLFDSVGLEVEQLMVEGALFYRIVESPRGFLDVYGGARYLALRSGLSLGVSDSGVRALSQRLSSEALEQMAKVLRNKAEPVLISRAGQLAQNAAAEARDRVNAIVTDRVQQGRDRISDIQEAAAAHPALAEILRNSERFKEALQDAALARLELRTAELRQSAAQAQAAADAAKAAAGRARVRAERALDQAEKKLAKAIESALREAIPSEISGDAGWVDPFIGLRARCELTDHLYVVAKGDVGGFGVSSDFTWQCYGAMGCHLNKGKSAAVELGYRHLGVDYQDGGFVYDVALSGVMLSFGFKF